MHQLGVRTYAPVCIRLPRVYIILILSHALQSIRDSKCESPDDGENSTIYLFINFFLDEKFECETRSHDQHRSNRYWATHAKTMTKVREISRGRPYEVSRFVAKIEQWVDDESAIQAENQMNDRDEKVEWKRTSWGRDEATSRFSPKLKKNKIKEKGGDKGFERGHGRGREFKYPRREKENGEKRNGKYDELRSTKNGEYTIVLHCE